MMCPKCKVEVHPMRVLGARPDAGDKDLAVPNGFYSQCPNDGCGNVFDEPGEPERVEPELQFRPMALPGAARQLSVVKSPPKTSGDPVEDLRRDIQDRQERLIALQAEAARNRNEQDDVKREIKGRKAMLASYERNARPRVA